MEDPYDHCGLLVSIVEFRNDFRVSFVITHLIYRTYSIVLKSNGACNLKKMSCISAVALLYMQSLKRELN